MKFYSLNRNADQVGFREATINGLAPDKSLYFPASIPAFSAQLINEIHSLPNEEIAFEAIRPYAGGDIPSAVLKKIVTETINFSIPLVKLSDRIHSLELFHGPTLAFKDVGARFMSRCLGYFAEQTDKKVTVLVATSGDTGGAVADGFYDVEGVQVVILYPSGKVSMVQEKQLTTLGKNIHALEIKGNFDDCQRIVKDIFNNPELKQDLFLTSANSINVARWLPQQFYYLFAWKQWASPIKPVISVPSGNFGNLCAAILAHASGMPVDHFIAACNSNDTIPRYLQSGEYRPSKTVATLSNAMDVSDPSNFVRIEEIYQQDTTSLKKILSAISVTEEETSNAILNALDLYGYQMDPHGAVAYYALENYLHQHGDKAGYFVETAHPVKFHDSVERITGKSIELPPAVAAQVIKEKNALLMDAEADLIIDFLRSL